MNSVVAFPQILKIWNAIAIANALEERKLEKDEVKGPSAKVVRATQQPPRLEQSHPRGLFPGVSFIRRVIKVNQKKQQLTKIVTETSAKTFKKMLLLLREMIQG